MKKVTIYTDGACLGNPGPGGYGVVLLYNGHRKEISGGFRLTTNNRMEIYAAIVGLSALNCSCEVTLYTDSRYLADAMNKGWVRRWKAKGWMRNKKEKALNVDLWKKLLELCEKHKVKFIWVKGHDGNPENERCDELSTSAARLPDLPADEGYERSIKNSK
ncbi:ribonuclease HI [Acetomicrobium mobile]|mgnify:FL=1|uniref:ribonuclease HI n=1 Tax=Acetomicrobium mobile TaxID=97477 RepID=UPI0026E9BB56|nr:ribonuclease HI [Acetomicrobium mobile]